MRIRKPKIVFSPTFVVVFVVVVSFKGQNIEI